MTIKLTDFYAERQPLIIYLNTNEEIKNLKEAVKDKIELYEGIGGKTPLHPKIKVDGKDKAKDYIIGPTRAGYGRLGVVVVCDTKNEVIHIHSPSRAETGQNQKLDLDDDLKRLLNKDGNPAKVNIDLIKGARGLGAEETDRACVLYIINILKEIKENKYNGKITSKGNPGEAEYDRINTEFIKLNVDTYILPKLDRLEKLNGELGEKEREIKDLKSKEKTTEADIKKLKEEIEKLKKDLEEAQKNAGGDPEIIKTLNETIEAKNKDLENRNEQINKLQSKLTRIYEIEKKHHEEKQRRKNASKL